MNIPFTIIVYGLVAASAEILGGSVVLMQKKWPQKIQEYLLALGAGFILALVLLDLIPVSITGIGPAAPLLILTGFSVMHFAEHTVVGHLHFGEECTPTSWSRRSPAIPHSGDSSSMRSLTEFQFLRECSPIFRWG